MKKIKFNSTSGFRIFIGLIISLPILFLALSLSSFSFKAETPVDDEYIRQISYDEEITTDFAVSDWTNFDTLEKLDILSARSFVQNKHVTITIENDSSLTVVTVYDEPAYNPDTWMANVYKSVTNSSGIYLYDENDTLLHSRLFESDPENKVDLTTIDLEKYGFQDSIPSYEEVEALTLASGYALLELDEGMYVVSDDTTEYFFDPDYQIQQTNYYKDDSLVSINIDAGLALENGLIIPSWRENIVYRRLNYGGIIRKTESSMIKNYKINNELIDTSGAQGLASKLGSKSGYSKIEYAESFSQSEMIPLSKLIIVPNPSNDQITLTIPQFIKSEIEGVRIINSLGKVVLENNTKTSKKDLTFKIGSFEPGLYQIEVKSGKNSLKSKFVKF